jgi:hypothetical protein
VASAWLPIEDLARGRLVHLAPDTNSRSID